MGKFTFFNTFLLYFSTKTESTTALKKKFTYLLWFVIFSSFRITLFEARVGLTVSYSVFNNCFINNCHFAYSSIKQDTPTSVRTKDNCALSSLLGTLRETSFSACALSEGLKALLWL